MTLKRLLGGSILAGALLLPAQVNKGYNVPEFNHEMSMTEELVLKSYQSVFDNVYMVQLLVTCKDGNFRISTGTGYNYRDSGDKSYYFAPKHVISPQSDDSETCEVLEKKLVVHGREGMIDGKLERESDTSDIVILSTIKDRYKPVNTPFIKIEDMYIGEDAYVVGYPKGVYRHVKKTNIATLVEEEDEGKKVRLIFMDGTVVPGMSGSPIFVRRQNKLCLAGMLVKGNEVFKNHVAIPVDELREYLR